jgi:HTH-type transcriptional regulator / antitoxin HigA
MITRPPWLGLKSSGEIPADSPNTDELDVLIALTGAYEKKHFPIEPPDPWTTLEYRLDQMGLTEDQIGRFMEAGKKVPELVCRESGLSLEDFMSLRDMPLEVLTPERP